MTPMQAIVALLILTLIVGGGNLLASFDQVQQYKASQQRQAAAEKASQQRQGQLLEHRLCTTLSRLAALKPPSGPAAANPSRAYLQGEHATLAQLGPDIGCDALHAARLPTASDGERVKPSLLRPAILGGFDGMASLPGVIIYLLLTGHPALIFATAASGSVTSAISMGGGEWLSDSDNGFAASAVMALATFGGALLPAVPFAGGAGAVEVAACAVICAGVGTVVSVMRPNRGRVLALAETFGILAACLAAVVACALLLPGGTA